MLLLQTRGINAANSRLSGGGVGVVAQDDFSRSARSLDGDTMSDGSSTWALGINGGFSINASEEAICDANAANVQYCDSMADAPAVKVRAKLGTTITGPVGVVARYDHANGYYYTCYRKGADTKGYIDRIDGSGTTAVVNSGATTYTNGDEIGVECDGTTITILKDDVAVDSATDAGGLSTGKAGLYGGSTNLTLDDFIAETI